MVYINHIIRHQYNKLNVLINLTDIVELEYILA